MQRPHPPIWYGAPNADAIAWAAPRSINVVSLGPGARARAISDRYREEWKKLGRADNTLLPASALPDTLSLPTPTTRRTRSHSAAYPRWRDAIEYLWRRANVDFVLKEIYPPDFAALERIGHGIAGSPATVRDYIDASASGDRRQHRAVPDGIRRHAFRGCGPINQTVRPRDHPGIFITASLAIWITRARGVTTARQTEAGSPIMNTQTGAKPGDIELVLRVAAPRRRYDDIHSRRCRHVVRYGGAAGAAGRVWRNASRRFPSLHHGDVRFCRRRRADGTPCRSLRHSGAAGHRHGGDFRPAISRPHGRRVSGRSPSHTD